MRALGRAAVAAMFLYLAVALVAFWFDATARAEPGPQAVAGAGNGHLHPVGAEAFEASPSPGLMRALMAWAASRLDLPVPATMPVIVRKSHCELQGIAYQSDDCPEPGSGVLALYDANVLWLRVDWRGDSLKDVSILLHELVHHMQHHAGIKPLPCHGEALERPAYEAQFAFLEAAGVDPFETIGINDLMLIFVTNCFDRH